MSANLNYDLNRKIVTYYVWKYDGVVVVVVVVVKKRSNFIMIFKKKKFEKQKIIMFVYVVIYFHIILKKCLCWTHKLIMNINSYIIIALYQAKIKRKRIEIT